MGAQMVYLREPVTGKEVQDGGDLSAAGLHYGLSAMQGWRRNMEDAHLAVTDLDENISLFGVFDGHGGRGVSRFAAGKLPGILRETEAYKQGDYAKALERAFLAIDELLKEAPGRREVEALDRPDAGAAIHPMVVPKKVLQSFLGVGTSRSGEPEDGGSSGEDEKRPEKDGEEGQAEAEADKENMPAAAGEAAAEAAASTAAPEAAAAEAPAAAAEGPADEAETEEEAGAEDGQPSGSGASGDAEDGEDWDDGEMALVDPSRLRDPTPEAQGCTAVVVLLVRRQEGGGPRAFCANAGDSRAILSRAGCVVALSEDHKPENPGETARITKAGGFVQQMPGGARVQGDLNLSRAIGDLRYKKPDTVPPEEQIVTAFPEVRTFPLTSEDEFMVLGCDGIWERTGNQEMVDYVRPRIATMENGTGCSLSKICGEICDKGLCPSMDPSQNEAFDGTGCDNMTVMIVQLKKDVSSEPRKRPAEETLESVDGTAESKKQRVEEKEMEEEKKDSS